MVFASGYFSIRHDSRLGFQPPNVDSSPRLAGSRFRAARLFRSRGQLAPQRVCARSTFGGRTTSGRTWHPIIRDLPGTAISYDWQLPPSTGIPDVRVRIVAKDVRFQNGFSTSRAFSITPSGPTPTPTPTPTATPSVTPSGTPTATPTVTPTGTPTVTPTPSVYTNSDGYSFGDADGYTHNYAKTHAHAEATSVTAAERADARKSAGCRIFGEPATCGRPRNRWVQRAPGADGAGGNPNTAGRTQACRAGSVASDGAAPGSERGTELASFYPERYGEAFVVEGQGVRVAVRLVGGTD